MERESKKILMTQTKNSSTKFNSVIAFLTLLFLIENSFGQELSNFINITPSTPKDTQYITEIDQDLYGYMWLNYTWGYAKYDGYNYTYTDIEDIFNHIETGDYIKQISKDFKNNIWIISKNGQVAVYDTTGVYHEYNTLKNIPIKMVSNLKNKVFLGAKNGNIYTFNHATSQIKKITTIPEITPNTSELVNITEDHKGQLFISTSKGKIYTFVPKKGALSPIIGPFSNYPDLLNITIDLNNNLWIATENFGLLVYDIENKTFIQDALFKAPLHNINNELFISIFRDSQGFIWAGTDGNGLYRIDPNNGNIQLFTHQNNNKFSLSSNTVLDIFEDNHGNIWVASNYGGINILPNSNSLINYYEGSNDNTPLRVLSIYKAKDGTLWIGTDGTGITRITKKNDGTTLKKQYFKGLDSEKGLYVQTITEDNLSNIWFGTYKNGLWCYNPNQDDFKKITIQNSKQQEATDIRAVFTDSKQRIWIASNLSVSIYNSNQTLLASFDNNTKGLKGHIGESIIEDTNGTIWIGCYKGGLFKFNENITNINLSHFTRINYYDEQRYKNDIAGIRHMSLDESGMLWLISSHGKLIMVNPYTNNYISYQDFEPLKTINFRAVLAENKDNIWLSSSSGIVHFNVKDSVTNTLIGIDGLQGNSFLTHSAFKDQEGKLYFGGVNGLNSFFPKNINKKPTNAHLYIHSIDILNKPAATLIPDQITSNIENLKTLKLKSNQSSFTFRFSAIDNILNPNYHYAYRLKGFNDEWISVKNERLASYTNIPSGHYVFEVKAGTKKDVWDVPPKEINITITPPFWNTLTAYIMYVLILALLVFAIKKWYDLKKKLILEKIGYNKEKELHNEKMAFFAKMSHEIQTPLTLIASPIETMLTTADKNGNLLLKQRLQIVSNNVKRLSRIAFELTALRDKELDKNRLFVTKNNLYDQLNDVALSFKEQARLKHIDFAINCPRNLSEAWYDKDKFEHIVYNLLANAFKFTPKEGNIQLLASPVNQKNTIKIAISDSGPGIPEEELNDIFTLFYQAKSGKKVKGTGIGLALTKELIDLHRGKIEVVSSASEGTTFTVTIPITKEAYLEEECLANETQTQQKPNLKDVQKPIKPITNTVKHNKTILIVEDNVELQHFLKELLSSMYTIVLAENGNEGYLYAKNNYPDLIISDIMMPELDGIEMCKRLQNDALTKHIPIVILTAKNSTTSKISSLESGAIEFINKPFNTTELVLKIKNIIKSTEHIINNFKKESLQTPEIKITKSNDDIFLENLISAINAKIENPNFRMEELADSLNMSYSVLYRKCQALTGESLIDLVRQMRLKKAAIVIAKYGYSISEAAYVSGFNDPKYFSKCFKKQYGKSPNIFKREASEMGYKKYLESYKLTN